MCGRSVRATSDEATRPLPGDSLIAQPIGSFAHAISVRRRPRDVWPWLAQMGAGTRAGWYSYDLLDNGRRPSAQRMIPELQHLVVGMIFPALPGVTDGFSLLAFEPESFLVLGSLSSSGTVLTTWAFILEEEIGCGATRLIVRVRAAPGYRFQGLPWWLSKRVIVLVHLIMQRRQLLGIAERAESMPEMKGRMVFGPAKEAEHPAAGM